jgi:hypothetical protein
MQSQDFSKIPLSFNGHVAVEIEETSGRVDIACIHANDRTICST